MIDILLVMALGIYGTFLHYVVKRVRGEVRTNVFQYILNYPFNTILTFTVVIGFNWLVYTPPLDTFKMAAFIAFGYLFDSALNRA